MPTRRRCFLVTAGSRAVLVSCRSRSRGLDRPEARDEEADEVTPAEELGDEFEGEESQLRGDHGFGHAVAHVAKRETRSASMIWQS